jgi:hypothetical protein
MKRYKKWRLRKGDDLECFDGFNWYAGDLDDLLRERMEMDAEIERLNEAIDHVYKHLPEHLKEDIDSILERGNDESTR